MREIPAEVFDRAIDWPAPAPEPAEPRSHATILELGDELELEAESEGGESE